MPMPQLYTTVSTPKLHSQLHRFHFTPIYESITGNKALSINRVLAMVSARYVCYLDESDWLRPLQTWL